MDDARVWDFEKSLWTADAEHYRACVDEECRMVLPNEPYVFDGEAAIQAVSATPRWDDVTFSRGSIARPQEGLIVVAYHAEATKAGSTSYEAWCTSTYRRRGHEDWTVVQHQQTPPLAV